MFNTTMDLTIDLITQSFNQLKLKYGCDFALSSQQATCILHLVNCYDLIGIMPTGSGKSIIMFMTSHINQTLKGDIRPVGTLIISPLESLMVAMQMEYSSKGFKCIVLSKPFVFSKDLKTWLTNDLQNYFIITSVETLFGKGVLKILKRECHIKYIFVDEAHTVVMWGEGEDERRIFRRKYNEIPSLRCTLDTEPILGLFTATMDTATMACLREKTGLYNNYKEVVQSPLRRNVFLSALECKKDVKLLNQIVQELKNTEQIVEKTIIFTNTADEVREIY